MGGIIKVIKILDDIKDEPDFMARATRYLEQVDRTNKVPFAIAAYGEKLDNFATGLRIKKYLKSCEDKSFRLVNKEPKNINSAVYKKEHLAESYTELNYLKVGKNSYMGITIAYQDVDAYAARDMDKTRDMGVGMLPPKLAQTMVNLASGDLNSKNELFRSIYDPFCGLGTVLIEAAHMGYDTVYGSDLSAAMVAAADKSMAEFAKKNDIDLDGLVFEADASKIAATIPDAMNIKTTSIVSEGYLGDVMGAKTITPDKIAEQCRKLARIYDGMFRDLRTIGFRGTIIICFPFWDNRGKDVFFEDIIAIIDRYGFERKELLGEDIPFRTTTHGSLLYRRPGQTVGREIYKLQLLPKEKLGLKL
jgi:tRNA G10  N-methylase Trm11